MLHWIEPQPVTLPADYHAAIGGNPIVANRLYLNGYTHLEQAQAFLDPDRYQPASASELPDLDLAANRLRQAIAAKERICVWGDFDVDGQTSTTLLVEAMRFLGAEVTYHIPVRATESHGITIPVLKQWIDAGLDLLLTCDTGITAHDAIDYANSRGVQVIVTDHHQLGDSLPSALAIVNPQRLADGHALSGLPGVGVAYQLARRLFELHDQPQAAERQLDLVALGIVADVAQQTGDTRYLLQRGLQVLRQPHRLGLQSLFARAETNPAHLTEEHIGFIIAPRLNALGRLSDANRIVEFLTTDDLGLARQEANFLEQLNNQRKLETSQVYQGALSILEQTPELLEYACLVLNNPAWPAGVIGIVASRLVDRFGKPTILLTSPPGEPARGSARSIPGVNITAAIAAQQDLLAGFGGHPMAAGLSITPDLTKGTMEDQISAFRKRLSATVQAMTGGQLPEKTVSIDAYLRLSELTLDLVADLNRLAPFGPGNRPPVLACRNLTLANQSVMGREAEHRLLTVKDEDGMVQRVVWWNGVGEPVPDGPFDLAFTVRASNFRGQEEVQVEWLDFRPLREPSVEIIPARPIAILDHRRQRDWLASLAGYTNRSDAALLIWAEGPMPPGLQAVDRAHLQKAHSLVIASIPPGPQELQAALDLVQPERVILYGYDPGLDELQPFMARLLGLVKHTLNRLDGQTSLEQLAIAMAHRINTIQAGLDLAQTLSPIHYELLPGGRVLIQTSSDQNSVNRPQTQIFLQSMLDETRAYRSYYLRADARVLIQPDQVAS